MKPLCWKRLVSVMIGFERGGGGLYGVHSGCLSLVQAFELNTEFKECLIGL